MPTEADSGDRVRCGAELVELSERFYRRIFVGATVFVGLAGCAALALLPLRETDTSYTTITILATALLVTCIPLAVHHSGAVYGVLRHRREAQLAVVAFAAALVVHPIGGELWWPSCALLMMMATVVDPRTALGYCLIVLLSDVAAHTIAGDFDETRSASIITMLTGYVFWISATVVFIDRFAMHIMRLNVIVPAPRRDVRDVSSSHLTPVSGHAVSRTQTARDSAAADSPIARLTGRQLQVVALLADGLRYDEVAACLAISTLQVQRHVANATERIDLLSVNELVALAVADEIVPVRQRLQ